MSLEKIEGLIIEILHELAEEEKFKSFLEANTDTPLYGGSSLLESIDLVGLLADLEDAVADEFDIDIIIADERAMSQRISPFRSVRSLTNYVQKLIDKVEVE